MSNSRSLVRGEPGALKRAVIYARISLDRTGSGLGIERQREDCEVLIRERGWQLVQVFADNDISAYSGKRRPGYRAMLDCLQENTADVVVAWHVDRLHRSPTELEEYIAISEETHTSTVTVRAGELDLSTAAGRMVARMLGAAARHESEQKSERISRRRRQDAEAGRAHGPLGFGYDDDQRIIPEEAAIVREITDRILAGDSLYSIADDLNKRAVPTPGAGRWYYHHVRQLRDPAVIRRTSWGEAATATVIPAVRDLVLAMADGRRHASAEIKTLLHAVARNHAADSAAIEGVRSILSSESMSTDGQIASALTRAGVRPPPTTWRAANVRTMVRRGTLCGFRDFEPGGRGGGDMIARGTWEPILTHDQSLALRRILDAPERRRTGRDARLLLSSILVCGRCGAPMGGHDSKAMGRRYACGRQPGLRRCGRLTVVADPVDEMVTTAVLAALTDANLRTRTLHGGRARILAAEKELAEVRRQMEEYAEDAARGRITRAEWLTVRRGLAQREREAHVALGARSALRTTSLDGVPSAPGSLAKWWENADFKRRREVIRTLVERVEIAPATRMGNRFDPARVAEPIWRF